MPRPWKRKAIIEDGELVTLKRLVKVGDSLALILPKDWLRFFATVDAKGNHWVKIKYNGSDTVIIGGEND